jgi:hypothetical protein
VKSLTNWLLWACGRVCQTAYCGRGGEFCKLVFLGVWESLTNWLLWAWDILTKWLLWARGRD